VVKGRGEEGADSLIVLQGEIRNGERARRGEGKEGETAKSRVMMAL
jgi:hypothetical protein